MRKAHVFAIADREAVEVSPGGALQLIVETNTQEVEVLLLPSAIEAIVARWAEARTSLDTNTTYKNYAKWPGRLNRIYVVSAGQYGHLEVDHATYKEETL